MVLDALPEGDILVHGDAHTKNIMIQNGEMLWIDMEGMSAGHPIYDLISIAAVLNGVRNDDKMTMGICGMDVATVLKFRQCFVKKFFKTEDPEMLQRYDSMVEALRLIRAVFAIGFNSQNTAQVRPMIIQVARQAFFPNIEKIVGAVKYLVNTL